MNDSVTPTPEVPLAPAPEPKPRNPWWVYVLIVIPILLVFIGIGASILNVYLNYSPTAANVSPITFEGEESYFGTDQENVYFRPWPEAEWKLLLDADLATFGIVSRIGAEIVGPLEYAKDKNRVYYYEHELIAPSIIDADPNTFTVLNATYSKDKNNIYIPVTLSIMDYIETARGQKKVLEGADPMTFEILNSEYVKDIESVWWNGIKVEGADPATFLTFDEYYYASDKNHIYRKEDSLDELALDPKTFVALNYLYVKDATQVYYISVDEMTKINVADPQTFVVSTTTSAFDAEDNNHKYLQGQIVQ